MHSQSFTSLKTFSNILRSAALQSNNLNDGLALLRLYARLHWDNISGHFGDDPLEVAFFERWRDRPLKSSQPSLPKTNFLHIATQTYEQGGHSRLLWRLIEGLSKHGTQALLVTDPRRSNHIVDFGGTVTRLKGKPAVRAAAIVAAGQKADTILLHIHPDDSAAAFAARILRSQGKKILFVNHADHVFSLGSGAADVVLEICMTGWKTTLGRRTAQAQSFMGIPIIDENYQVPDHSASRHGPIVSMGGGGKFSPTPGLSFPDFLKTLLPQIKNDVVLIGPSPKDAWWSEVTGAFPGRIQLCGPLPPKQVEDILKTASCYVDSFPLDGGTAYPQAAALGVPCFAPNAGNAAGVSPTDALRFETINEMQNALVSYINGGAYPFDLKTIQKRLLMDFSGTAVTDRVMSAARGCPIPAIEYLPPLGQRDSDYNARRWAEQNRVQVPKRIWRDISAPIRLSLYFAIREADLPTSIKSEINKMLATQWI
ncbi:hypothetical protein FEE96_09690 [Parasedimentitalea maritima]|uniref:Glycosyltransferase n=1 Tax=Parasedimentitalea maritima TaxID=2578117 RepID=A0ABY2UVU5_9RHOB|nr:hypothetical protein [Zongyanglinia marina]TLP65761.1 hypothetical protein FEE96_09690 [Zongyanglinia marina]